MSFAATVGKRISPFHYRRLTHEVRSASIPIGLSMSRSIRNNRAEMMRVLKVEKEIGWMAPHIQAPV